MSILKPINFFMIIGLSCYSITSVADIYRYVDKNGNITFTNTPKRGAQRLNIPSAPKKNNQQVHNGQNKGKLSSASKAPSTATGNTPKGQISNATTIPKQEGKNKKESIRSKILTQELANEENLLKQAQSDLAKTPNDVHLKKKVLLHQKNIQAIHKELKG